MKTILKTIGAATLLLGATGCTELTEYVVEGYVTDFEASDYSPAQTSELDEFEITFTFDPTAPVFVMQPEYEIAEGAIRYFQLSTEGSNLEILSDYPVDFDSVTTNFTLFERADGVDLLNLVWVFTEGDIATTYSFQMRKYNEQFIYFSSMYSPEFPELRVGSYTAEASYYVEKVNRTTESTISYYHAEGTVNSVSRQPGDFDDDEIVNQLDACPFSNTDENVSFGWNYTDVPNVTDSTGCSIMDHYQACTAEEQEERSESFFFTPMFSGPSYCEKQVSYHFVSEGLIDYREARTLRDALYQFYRSGGMQMPQ